MSSRNEILTNELSRLEKIAAMKNDDVLALENDKRNLKRKIDQLEMDILSWKSHASRADDSLLVESTENSPVRINDEGITPAASNTYSAAASVGINVTQHGATSTSDHQRTRDDYESYDRTNYDSHRHYHEDRESRYGNGRIDYYDSYKYDYN